VKNPILDLFSYLKIFETYLGRKMYYIFLLTLISGIAESFGILMLLPLLYNLDSGGVDTINDIGVPDFIKEITILILNENSISLVLVFIAIAFVIKGLLMFAALGVKAYFRGQLLGELKSKLFDRYNKMSYLYYVSRDTGHFINVVNEQVTVSLQAFHHLTIFGIQFVMMIVYLSMGFIVAWHFGVMALSAGVILIILFRRLNIFVRTLSRKASYENGHLSKLIIQSLHAHKYLSATGQKFRLGKHVKDSIDKLVDYQIRSGVAGAFTGAIREPIAVIFILSLLAIQLVFVEQPLAPIMVTVLLFYRGLTSLLGLQGSYQAVLVNIGSIELVHKEFLLQEQKESLNGTIFMNALQNKIEFCNVSFGYDDKSGKVVKNINLEIDAMSSVAIVGESGAGKSTIIDLITLLLSPTKGEIIIDGVTSNSIEVDSWRHNIGYVSQDAVIFDDTVANNICLWLEDVSTNNNLKQEIIDAAKKANIADFIDTLPDGYDTFVGDRGIRLSGGQKQRLFIARELFRKPSLLILDEATSSLDSESEFEIQKSIDDLKGQITTIIIAHRFSTIRNVDCIHVISNGKLIESGKFKELLDMPDSNFSRLAKRQKL
jgi:ABC-type multidrug transport system fused ATPase/permease subunit